MKLIHFACILSAFAFVACTNGGNSNKAASDSTATAQTAEEKAIQNELNQYIIQPPDTNYTGEYLDKYPNGNAKFKGFFRFGKRHGQWMAFYANGILWSECFYDKGLKHGANNVYYENGQPRHKGTFKNDLRDGPWVFYDVNGVEIKRANFKNDEEVPAN